MKPTYSFKWFEVTGEGPDGRRVRLGEFCAKSGPGAIECAARRGFRAYVARFLRLA